MRVRAQSASRGDLRAEERPALDPSPIASAKLSSIGETSLDRIVSQLTDTVLFRLATGTGSGGNPREILFVSDNCLAVLGRAAQEIMENGYLAYDLIHPADMPLVAQAEHGALEGGTGFKVRVRGLLPVPGGDARREAMLDIAASPTPLADGTCIWDGRVVDVTREVARAEEAERWRGVVEAADDLIAVIRLDGTVESINPAGRKMLGLGDGDPMPAPDRLWPPVPGGPSPLRTAVRHAARHGFWRGEAVLRRPDGSHLPVTQSLVAHREAASLRKRGKLTHFSVIMRDVSRAAETEQALRIASEMTEVELREMGHRVKNMFAMISAVVQLSSHTAPTVPAFASALRGRLASLARSHAATIGASARLEDAEMSALAHRVLEPYALESTETFRLDGPSYRLRGALSSTVGLVLHELATNAVKYGALRGAATTMPHGPVDPDAAEAGLGGGVVDILPWYDLERDGPTGCVELTWRPREAGGVDILWSESGGPAISPPAHRGFGTTLIDRIVAAQGGEIGRLWNPGGLTVRIALPEA